MCSLTRFPYSQPITALTISLTGSLLLVGTATGLVHLYDIASHQLLRTISTHKGMSISHLATMLKPPDLIGHVSLSLNVGSFSDAKDVIPVRPVVPFHRMKDAKARDAHEVMMMLPVQVEVRVSSD
jgi:pre-rRNA-processing protein IPI3